MTKAPIDTLYRSFSRSRRALGRSQLTLEQYDIATKQLTTFMLKEYGSTSVDLVDRVLLEDFLIDHMATRSPTTANKTFRGLRAFFTWMYEEDMIEANPFRKVKAPPPTPANHQGYTEDEVRLMLGHLRDEMVSGRRERYLAVRDYALFMVLYDTGLRATEMTRMSFEGIEPDTGIFELKGKGSKTLRRHLGETAKTAIQVYLPERNKRARTVSPQLWLNFNGFPFTRSGLFQMCKTRAEEVNIKDGGVHRWRYTHAEKLEDLGWAEEIIMAEMGHSVLSVSRSYRARAIQRKAIKQHELQSPADLLGQRQTS